MGCDASARLFYGFFADEEDSAALKTKILDACNGDWDEDKFLASLYGLTIPNLDYRQRKDWFDKNIPIYIYGWERGFVHKMLRIAVMVRLSYQFVLQIAEPIDPEKFQHRPEWDTALTDFCSRTEIKLPECKFWCLPEYS